MAKIRAASLKNIEEILDTSYFTKDSFEIETSNEVDDFLTIIFIPLNEFVFTISESDHTEGQFLTSEYPGMHMLENERFEKKDFPSATRAILPWARRIKEELDSDDLSTEVEDYINTLRESFEKHVNEEGKFTQVEIEGLNEKIDKLESLIIAQAEKMESSEQEIKKFRSEFENIKKDLPRYDKGVWYRIAGNKVVKTTKDFLTTPEGRKLLVDSVRKLLE